MTWGIAEVRIVGTPAWATSRRLRGSKARGLTFERKVGKLLTGFWSEVRAGVWFRYRDWAGEAWCQPDFYIREAHRVLVFECKLTECKAAWEQLDKYRAVLEVVYGGPVVRVQVCRNLRWTKSPVTDPRKVCDGSVWHTLG